MLHITNGDSVRLRESAIGGDVLVWLDVLHEGPVPADLPLEQLSAVRGAFLGPTASAALAARDRAVQRFAGHGEIVLWFEHDLFDQLQLIQILDFFAGPGRGGARLSLVQTSDYLGRMAPEALRRLWPGRRTVTGEQLALAARAWSAFRAPEPSHLLAFLFEDTPALPFLRAALLRQCEQFPSVKNGLARTETQILEAVATGPLDFAALFAADQAREEALFMGDTAFRWWVSRLESCRKPLLRRRGEVQEITAEGRDVLAGRTDHVRLNGIDRWLGGIHLRGADAEYRWDAVSGTLTSPA